MANKITKTQTYAVLYLAGEGSGVSYVAEELGLSPAQVKGVLKRHSPQPAKNDGAIKTKQSPVTGVRDLMQGETASGNSTVSVMTEAASQQAQEAVQKAKEASDARDTSDFIFRPE
jgi:predicted transcriptional regulator